MRSTVPSVTLRWIGGSFWLGLVAFVCRSSWVPRRRSIRRSAGGAGRTVPRAPGGARFSAAFARCRCPDEREVHGVALPDVEEAAAAFKRDRPDLPLDPEAGWRPATLAS
ncbi:hypothetical protein GCM10023084_58450 [Streptomyces lacrimifluminis]|uniref:Uncharacterized protein n=1 Tax=Streptomyces lacrimifluminis TaxID=1500077 RepID=A0A917LBF1_9ACTN|nr:hypothetical protein GCM10012282_61150 [Streptomyces lacrimifluminis]